MTAPHCYSWLEMLDRLSIDRRLEAALKYLSADERTRGISLRRLWSVLDEAWDELNAERSKGVTDDFLERYYRHPVWLLNSAFSESDADTIADRMAAVRLTAHIQPRSVLDFGGGIGTAARTCACMLENVERIDVVDIGAYRSSIERHLQDFPTIRVIEKAEPPYDAILCCEVLEHVPDPIAVVRSLSSLLRIGGALGVSWSFAPGLKCHLPENFHLRNGMLWVTRCMGFGFYAFERRGSPAYGFVKQRECDDSMERRARQLAAIFKLPLPWHRLLLSLRGL